MGTFISNSPGETATLGENWGRAASSGLVIALSGDLGAGKTQLTRGIARGLGIPDKVHSPTFALVNVYSGGRLPLFHLDLYRLNSIEQIHAAGLEEYLNPDGVSVIEWADKWFGPQPSGACRAATEEPARCFSVSIETLSVTQRRIVYDDIGL